MEAMNETKKRGENLASNPHSRRFRENTPEFNTDAKKHSGPALYTFLRQVRNTGWMGFGNLTDDCFRGLEKTDVGENGR